MLIIIYEINLIYNFINNLFIKLELLIIVIIFYSNINYHI